MKYTSSSEDDEELSKIRKYATLSRRRNSREQLLDTTSYHFRSSTTPRRPKTDKRTTREQLFASPKGGRHRHKSSESILDGGHGGGAGPAGVVKPVVSSTKPQLPVKQLQKDHHHSHSHGHRHHQKGGGAVSEGEILTSGSHHHHHQHLLKDHLHQDHLEQPEVVKPVRKASPPKETTAGNNKREPKRENFDFTSSRMSKIPAGPFDFLISKESSSTKKSSSAAAAAAVETGSSKKAAPITHQEGAPPNIVTIDNADNNSNNSASSHHEPFGSTEFPTLKRNMDAKVKPLKAIENEYESMTSLAEHVRKTAWTPDMTSSRTTKGAKNIEEGGLTSPLVISDHHHQSKVGNVLKDGDPIAPPPNFSSSSTSHQATNKDHQKQHKSYKGHKTGGSSSSRMLPKQPSLTSPRSLDSTMILQTLNEAADQRSIIQPSQVRLASLQGEKLQQRHNQQRNKRIRNRSLEMILDENRSSDSSPSRQRSVQVGSIFFVVRF
jgi:hypothetical protein